MTKIYYFLRNNWIFALLILFYAAAFFFDRRLQYLQFAENGEHLLFRKLTVYIPVIVGLLTFAVSLIFNYSAAIFIYAQHLYLYYIFLFDKSLLTDDFIFGASILVLVNYIYFTIASERGIFNFFGLRRFIAVVIQFTVLRLVTKQDGNFIAAFLDSDKPVMRYYSIFENFEIRIILIALIVTALFFIFLMNAEKYRPRIKFFCVALLINVFIFQKAYLTEYNDYMTVFTNIVLSVVFLALAMSVGFEKAYKDELTGIKGRRALNEEFHKLGSNYSIAMLDIDHFKKFNDTYGHKAGDIVLFNVAQILNKKLRAKVFRYGGEEFTIIYLHRNMKKIYSELDNTRKYISKTKINIGKNNKKSKAEKKVGVTVSIGVCARNKDYDSPEKVLRRADEFLYQAKDNGRNRVETDFDNLEKNDNERKNIKK